MYHLGKEQQGNYRLGTPVLTIYHCGKLVWEFIKGYLFTEDGYALKTEDDYVIKCEDQ